MEPTIREKIIECIKLSRELQTIFEHETSEGYNINLMLLSQLYTILSISDEDIS